MDRQLLVYERFDAAVRARLRSMITEDLVAEHAADPLGPHSDALSRVLNYFRRAPQAGKYVVFAEAPWQRYRIAVLSGVRGVAPTVLEDEAFDTEEAAMHGVFLRRIRDLEAD